MFILRSSIMVMISTRGKDKDTLSNAILKGLALDGGLYVPQSFTKVNFNSNDYKTLAKEALSQFFKGDELEDELDSLIEKAFNFPSPLHFLKDGKAATLELFHGPTAAFKDFGARFLAFSTEALLKKRGGHLTILVATSGDTGSAVASAFYKREGIRVKILFPKGGISPRQKKLLTIWGENIESYEVNGTFDDCQKMVKDAFNDKDYKEKYALSSANSINIARLLPQMTYYVYSSVLYFNKTGVKPLFIIPSGNVGNATAAYYALTIGAPIERIVLAQNANRPVVDYIRDGVYTPRGSIKTLANAMDVGAPSNIERLFNLYPTLDEFKAHVDAYSVTDDEILRAIKSTYESENYIICPHTACAKKVYDDHFKGKNAVIVSTADPAKFENVIDKAIGVKPDLPHSLDELLKRDEVYKNIEKGYKNLFL